MRAVTFDLWHTLISLRPEDEDSYMRAQFALGRRALAEAPPSPGAPTLSESELETAFESAYVEAARAAQNGQTISPVDQLRLAGKMTGRVPAVAAYLRRLAALVEATPFRIAPGALDLVQSLTEHTYKLGVISNTIGEPGALFRPILRSMGLDRFIDVFTFSDERPWTKPAPEIFLETLRALRVSPSEAVHVGDGWSDIEGARRAQLRAGILFTGLHEYGARYRELFATSSGLPLESEHRADSLEAVGEIIRRVLPPNDTGESGFTLPKEGTT
jgi:HAD superfamily hydrolase (TIGR01549 family)